MNRLVSGSSTRLVLGVVLAAFSFVAVAAPTSAHAASAASWAYQAVPAPPPNQPHSEFSDVSCPTDGFCLAVGQHLDGNGHLRPLAETWDGHSWRIGAAVEIAGVTTLDRVSCVDPSWCVALGSGRVLRWKGGHWRATGVDNGPRADLSDSGCATRSDCFMVGALAVTKAAARRGAYTQAAAWHWDGERWRRVHVPNAAHTTLDAVGCGARASCHVVGTYDATTKPRSRALVEYWNGHALRPVHLPQVTRGELYSIDCARAYACTAVGEMPSSKRPMLLADLAKGHWTVTHPAVGSDFAEADAVSCRAARVCTMVVSQIGASGDGVWTVAARGRTGAFHESRHEYNGLAGISCTATTCTVVGRSVADNRGAGDISSRDHPVALRGAVLKLVAQQVPTPPGATDRTLAAVSCVTGGFCAAITDSVGASNHSAVYLRSGGDWQPSRANGAAGPTGMSCVSTSFCMAVGHRRSLRWDGASWRSDPMPTPDGPAQDTMFGVSCVSADWCDAVGTTGNDSIEKRALVEHWDGASWRIMPVPSLSGHDPATVLVAISCTSTSFCLAVGHDVGSNRPLVESWNGTSWSIVTSPGLPVKADLDGVSCWTTRGCLVVSQTASSTRQTVPFAAMWNGTRFRRTTLAAPAHPVDIELSGASCSSATACVAVGADNQHLVPLVERWDGRKWTIARGQPTHAYQGEFVAVSCLAGGCIAVGDVYRNGIFVGTAAAVR